MMTCKQSTENWHFRYNFQPFGVTKGPRGDAAIDCEEMQVSIVCVCGGGCFWCQLREETQLSGGGGGVADANQRKAVYYQEGLPHLIDMLFLFNSF